MTGSLLRAALARSSPHATEREPFGFGEALAPAGILFIAGHCNERLDSGGEARS